MDALSATAELWVDDGSTCDPMADRQTVDEHFHDYGQLAYAASGALMTVTEHGTWLAPPNRITWIPPQVVHSRRSHGETDARILRVPASHCARLPARPTVFAATPLMREAYLALDEATLAAGDHSVTPRVELLLDIVAEEMRCAPEESLRLPVPRDDRLKAVVDILEADPSNPATLAELGRLTGASERTLSRLFRGELGMSFQQWRTTLRVQRALIELGAGRSVTEVSMNVGWANPTSFISAFTSLLGETPGRYRELAGNRHDRAEVR